MFERAKSQPSIVLFGYLGGCNLGDDAMLAGLFSVASPDAHFTVLARDVTKVVWPSRLTVDVRPARLLSAMRALLSADVVIRVGGTSFHDEYSDAGVRMLVKYVQLAMLFIVPRLLGKRVAALGIGAGLMTRRSTRLLAHAALSACHLVVVRDEASAKAYEAFLGTGKVVSGVDLAFLLEGVDATADGNGVLAVSVLDLSPFRGGDAPDQIKDWIALLRIAARVAKASRLRLLAFKDNDAESDLPLARALAERLKDDFDDVEIVSVDQGLDAMRHAIADSEAVVAARYHSAILAACADRPMIIVPYNAKLSHFREDLQIRPSATVDLRTLASGGRAAPIFCKANTTGDRFSARKAATRAAVVSMTRWENANV